VAGEDRTASKTVELERRLSEEPYKFGFFEALRRLECVHPDKPRIGTSSQPKDDAIRLGQEPSLAFAPATLKSFTAGTKGLPPRLSVLFFGLFGPNGPLPLHLTEYARDRLHNSHDPTFARFCDLFHHRLLSMFYRAWAAAQPTVSHDRPESDRFAYYIGSLFGIGMPTLRDRDAAPDPAKLFHSGHLSCQTRHAEGLRSILESFFEIPVEIEEFVGQWIDLPREAYWHLGESTETGRLGVNTMLGQRTWDRQGKFRVLFGPLSLEEYKRMLPGKPSLARLVALVRSYVGDELAWDVNPVLDRREVPPIRLGGRQGLGWTTWLAGHPLEKDPDDLLLGIEFGLIR
jgi:type VI secretion system protein ImpH